MAKLFAIAVMAAVSVAGVAKQIPVGTKKVELTDEEAVVAQSLIDKFDAADLIPNDGILEEGAHAEQKVWFLRVKEEISLDVHIEDGP